MNIKIFSTFAIQKLDIKNLNMYAIVEIAGQQFKIEKDQKIFVHRLNAEEGAKVEFNQVLLVDNDGKIKIGKPTVSGAKVSATVLTHLKGDKVLVFKKKRRKGYQKLNGHRQYLTRIEINNIEA
jgi:large subunit ribosomal protein L21